MEKSKKVRMPAGIRNKLTAAVAMLLVSSIMMVSSTYAWFTLSTAPEVTGITTSVGANGNLEMALLTTETFGDTGKIASAVGNSSAVTSVGNANITWGNLVDLSDASYGLQNINLQPARLKFAESSTTTLASFTGPLATPTYGKDGRVADLSGMTYSTILDASGAWSFVADTQEYGVRAIGANDNLTPQAAGLISAKAAYNSNLSSAKSTVQGALSTYGNALAGAITSLSMDNNATLEEDQEIAVSAMVNASAAALNYIDAAYKQVLLAFAASGVQDATLYANVASDINEAVNYAAALTALNTLAVQNNLTLDVPSVLTDAVAALNVQQTKVAQAQNDCNSGEYTTALAALVDTSKVIINGFDAGAENGAENALRDENGEIKTGALSSALINDGGAIVEMPDDSGVFAYVGSVAGNYSANCLVDIKYGTDINMTGVKATMKTTATVDSTVGTALNLLQPAASTGSSATVLSDTYGYALDFAFRTNAAESYLQLQTEGAQRVYSDSQSAATQGAGSTMTFQVTTTDAGTPTLTNEQVVSLMSAIRVAFVNPTTNEVYGIAALTNIAEGSDGFKGELYLKDYTVASSGALELGETKTDSAIMKLDQSVATRLTVIVYLDGDLVDNSDVANAAQSLVGSMNLQFSSSAELIPMQNTALQNMTITYSELTSDEYKAGLYTYNNVLYAVNSGYRIYQGSDNTVYFSNDETNYTKLTVMNASTAMTPLTVTVTANPTGSVEVGDSTVLTISSGISTVKSVNWTNNTSDIIEIEADEDDITKTTVTGKAAGTGKITAAVELEFTVTNGSAASITKNVTVEISVNVVAETFTVTFDANGGDGTMASVTGVSGTYTLPTTTTFTAPEGKVFGGWSTAASGTAITTASISVTEDTTLYAIWTAVENNTPVEEEEEPETYTVTLTGGEGYTIAAEEGYDASAANGEFKFTVTADENYEITSVSDGTNTLTPEDGVYTTNVTADVTITVIATASTAPDGE